ncbi:MAG TPA: penicillin acylase family protein [Acetobacteraceae bacterium]|nr:penicillin acylase family protein [Acetobacteraceae bacterium]
MRVLLRLLGRLGLVLLIVTLLAVAVAAAMVWSSVPPARDEAKIPGLSAPVDITLDEHGVPRIRAANERDAAMALGWVHARDRMFQMQTTRRIAEGRLSELAGSAAFRTDALIRTLGLAQRAREDVAALDPETRDLLDAYAEGVNAQIAARGRLTAPEFLVLGEPEPWRPEHSLYWGRLMGLWLSGSWRRDLERARLAAILPPERLRDLWPEDTSPGRPDVLADAGHLGRVLAALPAFPRDLPHPGSASNAWAVAPSRSATGGALLASDPHLGFQAPVLWYLARIELPDGRFRAGATSPGVPAIVIGRNESLAWGFTTTHSDTQDVFVERLAGPDAYQTPDGPRPFDVREERIAVRGQAEPRVIRVRETRHGPVVSDLDATPPGDGTVLSVAMANLLPGETSAAGLMALNRAASVAEARDAARLISSPPQNLMVADRAGRLAMYLTGRTPIRAGGDGAVPARGWDGSGSWTGFVPFDHLPHAEDPGSGALANANSRPAPPGPVFLGRDWYGDWRLRRIAELLGATPRHDVQGFARMQADTLSTFAREVLPALLAAPRPDGTAGRAQDLLRGWDGEMRADAPQPLIFHATMRALGRLALEAGGVPAEAWDAGPEFLRLVLAGGPRAAPWCGAEGCPALIRRAMEQGVAEAAGMQGGDPAAWRWGAVHVARFEHPLLRFVPGLAGLTRIAVPTGGDGETLARGGFRGDFTHVHGAGLRAVFDLADPDGVHAMIATGQSGHPMSVHWDDLNDDWAAGRLLRLGARPDRTVGEITLRP